jgi:hypothetical protein
MSKNIVEIMLGTKNKKLQEKRRIKTRKETDKLYEIKIPRYP